MAARKAAKPAKAARKAPAPKRKPASPKKGPSRSAPKKAGRAAPKRAKAAKAAKRASPGGAAAAPAASATGDDAWVDAGHEGPRAQADPWLETEPGPASEGWEVVEPSEPQWADPVAEPTPAPAPAAARPGARWPPAQPAFDTRTGEWLPAAPAPAAVAVAPTETQAPPEARRKGAGPTFWTAVLGIDLALLAFNVLAGIAAGIILVFTPESEAADRLREAVSVDSREDLLWQTLVTFAMFGVIPFLWVLGTRMQPREGTKRYLRLHDPAKGFLRGVLLTIPLLVAVIVLSAVYTIATQGVGALDDPPDDSVNPAVEGIMDNLDWPLAVVIALCAGLGEEIFFRGVLQRWIGVWGQAVLFGLAHAAGGYLPQILFALGLGVLFGYLLKRGWSLWSLVTAHVLYDLVLLSIGLLYG